MSTPAPKKPGTKSALRLHTKSAGVVSADEHTEFLKRTGNRPSRSKVGLPANLPVLRCNSHGAENLAEVLAVLEQAHGEGYGCATLEALNLCFMWTPDAGVPGWVRGAFCEALQGWKSRRYKSLEVALNAQLARTKRDAAYFAATHGGQIFLDVQHANHDGVSIGDELFAVIGKRFGVPAATIERVYYGMVAQVERVGGRPIRKRKSKSAE